VSPTLIKAAALATALLSVAIACDGDEPSGSGGSSGKAGGAGVGASAGTAGTGASSGAGGSGGVSGAPGSGGGESCGSCAKARSSSPCGGDFAACKQHPGCKSIYDCVYGSSPGCALGAYGAACMNQCVLERCSSDESAKLFLQAELCAYCDGSCSLCSEYCGASTLTPDSVVCPQLPDAGDAASDVEADGMVESGASDASSE
jgi:hypothetical protein